MSNENSAILNELKKINERFDAVDARFDAVDSNYQEVKKEISELKTGLKNVNLILEDEIRPNINIIAEGHLALNQKLDEALKITQEEELMKVRLNVLESEVRKLNDRVAQIA